MKIARSYNKIAESYDEYADKFHLLTSSRFSAIQQIADYFGQVDEPKSLLDIGVGSGIFLEQLRQEIFKQATFTGLDVSKDMLELAKVQVPGLNTVCGDINAIDAQLKGETYDLIIAHFVLAYVELEAVLEKAKNCLKENGVISIITTTYESFLNFQKEFQNIQHRKDPLSLIVQILHKRAVKKTLVPESYQSIETIAKHSGFSVIQRQQIQTQIKFNKAEDMVNFSLKGGWLLNAFDYWFVPVSLCYPMAHHFFKRYLPFPWEDRHVVEVVLLKRDEQAT